MNNIKIIKKTDIEGIFEGDYYYTFMIDEKESSMIAETYDMAMILALSVKYDGVNTQAPKMISRMLNIKSAWSD
jgi:hypothetical protein